MSARLTIDLISGPAAHALLATDSFRAQWAALMLQCPWATTFQGPDFVGAWYRTYRERFEPLLVISRSADGRLQGMLSLAVSNADGHMVVAGSFHAEYHVWICPPEWGNLFPSATLKALRPQIPASGLKFRYLPPHTPIAWTLETQAMRITRLRPHPRPLLPFGNGDEIRKSLSKSGNKSRLKRLQKLGPVECRRINTPDELEAYFDQIIRCYDTRRLALNGSAPFRNDPLKKSFHLEMMRIPGLLHVTLLTVGDQVASAQLNTCGKHEVHLSLIAHNPFFSNHSPGKLHILQLCKMLMAEGYKGMDLTAGGDSYKERFADAWDQVHTLTLYPSSLAREHAGLLGGVEHLARKVLKHYSITPWQAVSFAGRIRQLGPVGLPSHALRRTRGWLTSCQETRVYRYDLSHSPLPEPLLELNRDALGDLLAYRPAGGLPPQRDFMSEALARIEDDQHLYSRVEDGRLLHFAWLAERPTPQVTAAALPGITLPPDSALVLDLHTVPHARRRGWATSALRTMLRDAARRPQTSHVFVAIPAVGAAREVVEKIGFTYVCSLFEQKTFGQERRWANPSVNGNANGNGASHAHGPAHSNATLKH